LFHPQKSKSIGIVIGIAIENQGMHPCSRLLPLVENYAGLFISKGPMLLMDAMIFSSDISFV
jgi:hypothetical protein